MPTLTAKLLVVESATEERSVQVVIGSDVLRAHNADILFSVDKLMIHDEERNRLAIPLVRPENDATFKGLLTLTSPRGVQSGLPNPTNGAALAGIIGRPSRESSSVSVVASPIGIASAALETVDQQKQDRITEAAEQSHFEVGTTKPPEDARSATESDKSFTTPTPASRTSSGVWGNSWRSSSVSQTDTAGKTASGYSRAGATTRGMKVLRPTKSMASSSRAVSGTAPGGTENIPSGGDGPRRTSLASTEGLKSGTKVVDSLSSQPTKSNPVGQASAFGWLNSGQQ